MSQQGLKKVAAIFSQMQETRLELIKTGLSKNDHQDIILGQMLEEGKNAMKDTFTKLTLSGDAKKFL